MATFIQKMVLEFNCNSENRSFINNCRKKSFMEGVGVARSEEAHSNFWAWLLKADDIHTAPQDAPFMWFLHALVLRDNGNIPSALVTRILARDLQFSLKEVRTEKKVKGLAPQFFSDNWPNERPSEDEIDLYIACDIQNVPGITQLEIIVENKILSLKEGLKDKVLRTGYDELMQTDRYSKACASTASPDKLQLFVYLTPNDSPEAVCPDFIHIFYQDLLDIVLTQLLCDEQLSPVIRTRICDYVETLSLPTMDIKSSKRIILAVTAEERQSINRFLHRNRVLLCHIALAKIRCIIGATPETDDEVLLGFLHANKPAFEVLSAYYKGEIDLTGDTVKMVVDDDWVVSFVPSFTILYKKSWIAASDRFYSIPMVYFITNHTSDVIGNVTTNDWRLEVSTYESSGAKAVQLINAIGNRLGATTQTNHNKTTKFATHYKSVGGNDCFDSLKDLTMDDAFSDAVALVDSNI